MFKKVVQAKYQDFPIDFDQTTYESKQSDKEKATYLMTLLQNFFETYNEEFPISMNPQGCIKLNTYFNLLPNFFQFYETKLIFWSVDQFLVCFEPYYTEIPNIELYIPISDCIINAIFESPNQFYFNALKILFKSPIFCKEFLKTSKILEIFEKCRSNNPLLTQFISLFDSQSFFDEIRNLPNYQEFLIKLFKCVFSEEATSVQNTIHLLRFLLNVVIQIYHYSHSTNTEQQNIFNDVLFQTGIFDLINKFLLRISDGEIVWTIYHPLLNCSPDPKEIPYDLSVFLQMNKLYINEDFSIQNKQIILKEILNDEIIFESPFAINQSQFPIHLFLCQEVVQNEELFWTFVQVLSKCIMQDQSFADLSIRRIIELLSPPIRKNEILYESVFYWLTSIVNPENDNPISPEIFNDDFFFKKLFIEPSLDVVEQYFDFPNYRELFQYLFDSRRNKFKKKIIISKLFEIINLDKQKYIQQIKLNKLLLTNFDVDILNFYVDNLANDNVLKDFGSISSTILIKVPQLFKIGNTFKIVEKHLKSFPEHNEMYLLELLMLIHSVIVNSKDRFFDEWVLSLPKDSPLFQLSTDILSSFVYNKTIIFIPSLVPLIVKDMDIESYSPYNLYLIGRYSVPAALKLGITLPKMSLIASNYISYDTYEYFLEKGQVMNLLERSANQESIQCYEFFFGSLPGYITLPKIDDEMVFLMFYIKFSDITHKQFSFLRFSKNFLGVDDNSISLSYTKQLKQIQSNRWYLIRIQKMKLMNWTEVYIDNDKVATVKESFQFNLIGDVDHQVPASYFVAQNIFASSKIPDAKYISLFNLFSPRKLNPILNGGVVAAPIFSISHLLCENLFFLHNFDKFDDIIAKHQKIYSNNHLHQLEQMNSTTNETSPDTNEKFQTDSNADEINSTTNETNQVDSNSVQIKNEPQMESNDNQALFINSASNNSNQNDEIQDNDDQIQEIEQYFAFLMKTAEFLNDSNLLIFYNRLLTSLMKMSDFCSKFNVITIVESVMMLKNIQLRTSIFCLILFNLDLWSTLKIERLTEIIKYSNENLKMQTTIDNPNLEWNMIFTKQNFLISMALISFSGSDELFHQFLEFWEKVIVKTSNFELLKELSRIPTPGSLNASSNIDLLDINEAIKPNKFSNINQQIVIQLNSMLQKYQNDKMSYNQLLYICFVYPIDQCKNLFFELLNSDIDFLIHNKEVIKKIAQRCCDDSKVWTIFTSKLLDRNDIEIDLCCEHFELQKPIKIVNSDIFSILIEMLIALSAKHDSNEHQLEIKKSNAIQLMFDIVNSSDPLLLIDDSNLSSFIHLIDSTPLSSQHSVLAFDQIIWPSAVKQSEIECIKTKIHSNQEYFVKMVDDSSIEIKPDFSDEHLSQFMFSVVITIFLEFGKKKSMQVNKLQLNKFLSIVANLSNDSLLTQILYHIFVLIQPLSFPVDISTSLIDFISYTLLTRNPTVFQIETFHSIIDFASSRSLFNDIVINLEFTRRDSGSRRNSGNSSPRRDSVHSNGSGKNSLGDPDYFQSFIPFFIFSFENVIQLELNCENKKVTNMYIKKLSDYSSYIINQFPQFALYFVYICLKYKITDKDDEIGYFLVQLKNTPNIETYQFSSVFLNCESYESLFDINIDEYANAMNDIKQNVWPNTFASLKYSKSTKQSMLAKHVIQNLINDIVIYYIESREYFKNANIQLRVGERYNSLFISQLTINKSQCGELPVRSYRANPFVCPSVCPVVAMPSFFSIKSPKPVSLTAKATTPRLPVTNNSIQVTKANSLNSLRKNSIKKDRNHILFYTKSTKTAFQLTDEHPSNLFDKSNILNLDETYSKSQFETIFGIVEQYHNCTLIRQNLRVPSVCFKMMSMPNFGTKYYLLTDATFSKYGNIELLEHTPLFAESILMNDFGQFSMFCGHFVIQIEEDLIVTSTSYCYPNSTNLIFSAFNGFFILEFSFFSIVSLSKFKMSITPYLQSWLNDKISNKEYLECVNFFGMRSFADFAAYPIYPRLLNELDKFLTGGLADFNILINKINDKKKNLINSQKNDEFNQQINNESQIKETETHTKSNDATSNTSSNQTSQTPIDATSTEIPNEAGNSNQTEMSSNENSNQIDTSDSNPTSTMNSNKNLTNSNQNEMNSNENSNQIDKSNSNPTNAMDSNENPTNSNQNEMNSNENSNQIDTSDSNPTSTMNSNKNLTNSNQNEIIPISNNNEINNQTKTNNQNSVQKRESQVNEIKPNDQSFDNEDSFLSNFRDLSKPIQIANNDNKQIYINRYKTHKFNYSENLSNPLIVSSLNIRLAPFCFTQWYLNDGWDKGERDFTSIAQHLSISKKTACEIPPEFYSFPEILMNKNKFRLNNNELFNLTFPSWCKCNHCTNCKNNKPCPKAPFHFIEYMKYVLELDIVRKNLHQWIDLNFGVKQNSVDDINVYSPLSYMTTSSNEDAKEEERKA